VKQKRIAISLTFLNLPRLSIDIDMDYSLLIVGKKCLRKEIRGYALDLI
jgi:hypothetical protein